MRLATACPKRLSVFAGLAILLGLAVFSSPASSAGSAPLVGSNTVYSNVVAARSGTATAFKTSASASGTVADVRVYLDSGSRAMTLIAGLYAASGSHPGTLLARGALNAPTAGAWNTVALSSRPAVTAGRTYWIAVLSPAGNGTLRFRDAQGGGASETSHSTTMGDLVSTWSTGAASVNGPVSAFGETSQTTAPDTSAPSTPSGLAVRSVSASALTLGWSASTDNVAVTGYDVSLNGTKQGTTSSTGYSISGLACGKSYTVSVDAYDAAGNRSSQATVTASTSACSSGGGGSSSNANLWVDTSGGTCARQSTVGSYVDAQACSSFSAALAAASCGDTVAVQPGAYGSQSVSATKNCTSSNPVTFVAQGSVTLSGGLDVKASYVTFSGSGFNFAQTYTVEQGASYVSFVGVSAPHAFIMGSHVTIQGGQIGPNNVCSTGWEDGLQIWDNGSSSASYVTVDGVIFHDVSDNGNQCSGFANSGVHVDCIQMLGPNNVTIENSHFYNCATSDVIGRPYTTPFSNITIQNNMMGPVVTPGASINIGSTGDVCNNVVIQYNTVSGTSPSAVCGGSGSSGNVVRANIFPGYSAQAGFTNSYNITESTSALGTGSKKCTPIFNPGSSSTADYHLSTSDTCAKNAGDPSHTPATDIDGDARPAGSAPDAGADEVG